LDNFLQNYFFAVLSEIERDQEHPFCKDFRDTNWKKKFLLGRKILKLGVFLRKRKKGVHVSTLAQSLFRNMNILIAPALSY
jgi:hypothetical protein